MPRAFDDRGNVFRYGAKFDGASHPLSSRFGSLSRARRVYPLAQSLEDEIDLCAIEKAVNLLTQQDVQIGGIPKLKLPAGVAYINRPIILGSRRVNVEGAGPAQTVLHATTQCPFFMSYPDATPTPVIVDGPNGTKALDLSGTSISSDGFFNLSDVAQADFTTYGSGKTFELWAKMDTLPPEGEARELGLYCSGCLYGDLAFSDMTLYPQVFTSGGVLKLRLFSMVKGLQDFGDIPLTGVTAGTWHHYAFTIVGDTRKLFLDGVLIGSRVTANTGQTRSPWENITVGRMPRGGIFEGGSFLPTIDGQIRGIRISNNERYTGTFTPYTGDPPVDSNTLCVLDLNNVSGILAKTKSGIQQPLDGYTIWRKGAYSGDITGANISNLGFHMGTMGWYAYGVHDIHTRGLYSYLTRYPLYFTAHSFRNTVSDVYFGQCRIGVVTTAVSPLEVYNAQISGCVFAVASEESQLKVADCFTHACTTAHVYCAGAPCVLDNYFPTDETQVIPTTYGAFLGIACYSVSIRDSLLFFGTSTDKVINLHSCDAGSLTNVTAYGSAGVTEIVAFTGNAPKKNVIVSGFITYANFSLSTILTTKPHYINNLDKNEPAAFFALTFGNSL